MYDSKRNPTNAQPKSTKTEQWLITQKKKTWYIVTQTEPKP